MTRDEKLDLISRALDDALGEGDVARLEALMVGDPEFAECFLDLSMQHARLRRLARTPEVAPMPVRVGRWRRAMRGEEGGFRRAAIAAAALLVAAFGLFVMIRPRATPVPVAVREVPPEPEAGPPPAPPETAAPERRPEPGVQAPAPPLERREATPRPTPEAAPVPEPPRVEPPPVPPPASRTEAAVAKIERIEGDVFALAPERTPARIGQALLGGQGLAAEGKSARAVVLFTDGTRLDLGADTVVSRLADPAGGKRVELRQGTLAAEVPRQPPGSPMVFATPQAEATVLGTELTLSAGADATRLEVREGRVRLARAEDGAAVDVPAGHFAAAARGVPLAAQPLAGEAAARRPEVPVGSFTLIDAGNGRPVPGFENLRDGTVLNLARLPRHINIRFNPSGRCASVRFGLDANPDYWIEDGPPYLLAGDRSGRIFAWAPRPGVHAVTATPYEQSRAAGRPGAIQRVTVQVIDKP